MMFKINAFIKIVHIPVGVHSVLSIRVSDSYFLQTIFFITAYIITNLITD